MPSIKNTDEHIGACSSQRTTQICCVLRIKTLRLVQCTAGAHSIHLHCNPGSRSISSTASRDKRGTKIFCHVERWKGRYFIQLFWFCQRFSHEMRRTKSRPFIDDVLFGSCSESFVILRKMTELVDIEKLHLECVEIVILKTTFLHQRKEERERKPITTDVSVSNFDSSFLSWPNECIRNDVAFCARCHCDICMRLISIRILLLILCPYQTVLIRLWRNLQYQYYFRDYFTQ